MDVRQVGNALFFSNLTRPIIEAARELPGRKKWKEDGLWVEGSGENVRFLVSRFPELSERGLGRVDEWLGVKREQDQIRRGRELPPEASAFPFKTTPYEHQLKAFGLSRHAEFFGLFMEMGTGKTKVLIDSAFSLYAEGYLDRVIVIAPNGVHQQWVNQQIPEHAPDFPWSAHAYVSGMSVREARKMRELMEDRSKLQWFTMAFESLASKKAQAQVVEWIHDCRTMMILDESQKIKNPSAARTKFLLKCAPHVNHRRIATGTEVTQGLEDLYSQLKFLHPDILGHNSYYSFRNEYCRLRSIPGAPAGAYQIVGYQNVDKLREAISGCTFQVLKKDCLDLPEKVRMEWEVPMTPAQSRAYKQMKQHMVAEIGDKVVSAPIALTQLMKLQQIVSGQLVDEDGETHYLDTGRPAAVLDILEERKSAIVWARFRADIERLAEVLEKAGYRVGTYYGSTSEEERARLVQPGAVDVLIANPQSAGAGLNLTHFNTAIYYSNSFNAGDRWQSEDRIHRIGQKDECLYIDLVSPGTVDRKLVSALHRKRLVADSVRGEEINLSSMLVEELTEGER